MKNNNNFCIINSMGFAHRAIPTGRKALSQVVIWRYFQRWKMWHINKMILTLIITGIYNTRSWKLPLFVTPGDNAVIKCLPLWHKITTTVVKVLSWCWLECHWYCTCSSLQPDNAVRCERVPCRQGCQTILQSHPHHLQLLAKRSQQSEKDQGSGEDSCSWEFYTTDLHVCSF